MNKQQRVRYEMYQRVRDFGIANRELFPEGSGGERAFSTLTGVMAQIDAHITAKPVDAVESLKVRASARQAVTDAMRKIARTAKGRERSEGETNKLAMPRRTSTVAIIKAAWSFIREAEAVKHELIDLGLPTSAIDDLRQKVEVLERVTRGRSDSRRSVALAEGDVEGTFRLASKAIAKLDVIVPNIVDGNHGLMAAWKRDREVVGGRSYKRKPAPDPQPQPEVSGAPAEPANPLPKAS